MKTVIMCAVLLVAPCGASAEGGAAGQLIKDAGGIITQQPDGTNVAPTTVIFPKSGLTGVKVPPSQMAELLKLARYVYDTKPDGIEKSNSCDIRHFEIGGDKLADGAFELKQLIFNLYTPKYNCAILVYPNGTIDSVVEYKAKDYSGAFIAGASKTRPLDKDWVDLLMKEVSFWIENGTKSGGYNPKPVHPRTRVRFEGGRNYYGGGGDHHSDSPKIKGEGAHWDDEGSGQGAGWNDEGAGQGSHWNDEGAGQGAHWNGD